MLTGATQSSLNWTGPTEWTAAWTDRAESPGNVSGYGLPAQWEMTAQSEVVGGAVNLKLLVGWGPGRVLRCFQQLTYMHGILERQACNNTDIFTQKSNASVCVRSSQSLCTTASHVMPQAASVLQQEAPRGVAVRWRCT